MDKLENLRGLNKNQIKLSSSRKSNKSELRENENKEKAFRYFGGKMETNWGRNSILFDAIKMSFLQSAGKLNPIFSILK